MNEPGSGMAADIAEQPAMFDRLLTHHTAAIAEVAARIARRRPRHVSQQDPAGGVVEDGL